MENPHQNWQKRVCDFMKILHREVRTIQLHFIEPVRDYLLNDSFDSTRSGVFKTARRSLNRVCKHDNCRFLRTRLWPRITEIGLLYLLFRVEFNSLIVEVGNERFPVMFAYYGYDWPGQFLFLGSRYAILHVGLYDESAKLGTQLIMRVFDPCLIVSEILRFPHLSDIVIVGSNPRKE